MDLLLPLSGALPALFLMFYVDRMDALRPEPKWALRRVALAGALSVIPVIFIEEFLMAAGPVPGSLSGEIYKGFVVAGFTEEVAKALCLYLFVWKRPEFNERFDGVVYAVRAGLGFAMVENVFYLMDAYATGGFAMTFVMRALLAVPLHAICAGFMGGFAAMQRFDGKGPGLIGGLLLAIGLHGAYDAAIFAMGPLVAMGLEILVLPLVLVPIVIVWRGRKALLALSEELLRADAADVGLQAAPVELAGMLPMMATGLPAPAPAPAAGSGGMAA